jgi:HD-GYP domain-containing protein (c-di-GMP phosphodiesterase class II)
LANPSKLSRAEFEIVKSHVTKGFDIIKDIKFKWNIADIVVQHHERLDGSGYPNGIKKIYKEALIIGIADEFEAMASHRPYRPAIESSEVIRILKEYCREKFGDEISDAILTMYANGELDKFISNK